tara:strand:+ start:330 stop:956 length:627 start_codon:yes stop_codon:yes gene_type:complete
MGVPLEKDDLSVNLSDSEQKILNIGEPYIALREQLKKDLERTGFNPKVSPPCKEPTIVGSLSDSTERELRDLYDVFLSFYDYLTDEITRCEIYLGTTKERANTVFSAISLEVLSNELYKNAESRKHAASVHPAYLIARKDYLYFSQLHSALEERRRKMSKSMERIHREISFRIQDVRPSTFTFEKEKSTRQHKVHIKNMFKPIADEPE